MITAAFSIPQLGDLGTIRKFCHCSVMYYLIGNFDRLQEHYPINRTPRMGVDVGMKVRLLDEDGQIKKEVEVSSQDNSLASVLDGGKEVRYLSIRLDEGNFLSTEDYEKVRLHENMQEEMMSTSQILDAKDALRLMTKIHLYTNKRIPGSLDVDHQRVNAKDTDQDQKTKDCKMITSEYSDFQMSMGILIGILKVAAITYPNVQLVGEYY